MDGGEQTSGKRDVISPSAPLLLPPFCRPPPSDAAPAPRASASHPARRSAAEKTHERKRAADGFTALMQIPAAALLLHGCSCVQAQAVVQTESVLELQPVLKYQKALRES